MSWWETWPDRYPAEIERLQRYGWNPVDSSSDDDLDAGYRVIEIQYSCDGQAIPVRLCFPPEYPYFMALAHTEPDQLLLNRHHNPVTGELCLLNGGESWRPGFYMADVIAEKMPEVLQISENPEGDFAREAEAAQGEPLSGYLPATEKTLLLIDGIQIPAEAKEGSFTAHTLPGARSKRYAITEVRDITGSVLSLAPERLRSKLKAGLKLTGRWRRIEPMTLTRMMDLNTLANEIHQPTMQSLTYGRINRHETALLATVYSEEVSQGNYQDAWFGIEVTAVPAKGKQKKNNSITGIAVHGAPYSPEHRFARSPELKALPDAHACIVGTGMLGSPLALQLARAGVGKLTLIDPDYIELATTIRFALGASYAGWSKVEALQDYIGRNYPLVEVEAIPYRLGTAVRNPHNNHYAQMIAAFEQADLIIDAAAEKSVSFYLCHLLRGMNKRSLALTTRPGSWGGDVWSSEPNGPCWECFERHNQKGGALPMPNGDDESDRIQIGGCAQPTTIGNGFDADLVVLNATRQAIGLLTAPGEGYPAPDWNALVVNMRSAEGGVIAPTCLPLQLSPHPECTCQGMGD